MNLPEEELQKAIENEIVPKVEGPDAQAYREVFRVLRKPADVPLPAGFAERVAQKIVRRQKKLERRDYFWYAAGILLLAIASFGTIRYTGFRFDFGFLKALVDYQGLFVFAIIFIVFLNWVDQRFIRKGLSHPFMTENSGNKKGG